MDYEAEYAVLMQNVPRPMPDDWETGLVRGTMDGKDVLLCPEVELGAVLTGDVEFDARVERALRQSVWNTLELRRLFPDMQPAQPRSFGGSEL